MKRQIAGLVGFAAMVAAAAAYAAYEDRAPAPAPTADVRIELDGPTARWVGSGVHLAPGYILTNNHVACSAETPIVKVRGRDSELMTATVLWCNKAYDLAAIAVDKDVKVGKTTRPITELIGVAELDCREAAVGETFSAVGNPAGLEFVTMAGRVAGKAREIPGMWKSVLLVDMTMISGMSGGPVYGEDGRVIGINVGTLSASDVTKAPGQGGLSMVIPASVACALMGRA